MKQWRKLQWAKNRAYISLRFSEILYAGLDLYKPYFYSVSVGNKKLILRFKRVKRRKAKKKVIKEEIKEVEKQEIKENKESIGGVTDNVG